MTRDELMRAADDLDAAADVIDARGWCQRRLSTPDGRVCAEGAILAALGAPQAALLSSNAYRMAIASGSLDTHTRRRAHYAVAELRAHIWRQQTSGAPACVYDWNDQKGMTRDEVTDTIRRAAEAAREKLGAA